MANIDGSSRLLLLTALADEDADAYDLIGFHGREALSEPFLYRLDLHTRDLPAALGSLIGQLAEWVMSWANDEPRTFAGRIYEARLVTTSSTFHEIQLVVRPAYWATSYARGFHFTQDKSSLDIFDAVTADVPGLVTDKQASSDARAYAVRYDETELDFLDRLLAQDGIFYYFRYDKSGGAYRHKMVLANAVSGYVDVPGEVGLAYLPGAGDINDTLGLDVAASAGTRRVHGYEVSKLDTPFRSTDTVTQGWSSVYAHGHDEIAGNALSSAVTDLRSKTGTAAVEQSVEVLTGGSLASAFFAGGRVELDWQDVGAARKVVLTSVEHSVIDLSDQGGVARYSNRWTAIAASQPFRPPVASYRRRAYGPILGVVKDDGSAEGQVVVDSQSRIPVTMSQAVEGDLDKPFKPFVWLPVTQQWAASTHGAQFFPRIGARVMIDFLYGDPDLPFVAGTFYTPSAAYPFDPSSNATQTGWRSVTDKDGSIKQEFMFEDKPGGEEVYMYTGRNYRRQIDNDELGTIKNDRTIEVQHDHKETVKNDQTVTIEGNQKESITKNQTHEVTGDRSAKVTGKEDIAVTGARTVKVTQKNTLESMLEIELKVGPSSIKLDNAGITIKAPIIKIQGDGMVQIKSPMTQVNGDGLLMLKGGIVMIN